MPKRVFAVAAHPDDIEFVMAGTMMLLHDTGYELHYMNVANGCCGSTRYDAETTARVRRAEAQQAAEHINATFHDSLTNDLEIFYNRELLLRLSSIMRDVEPSIVLTHSPQDYMEDHMNTARLAVTAAFSRGMPNFPVDPPNNITEQPVAIYHAQPHGNRDGLRRQIRPDVVVDVSSKIDEKVTMLAMHKSQKEWLDQSQGMDSYTDSMKELCAEIGRFANFPFGEGWRQHSHLGFSAKDFDPLTETLKAAIHSVDPVA
jgi:LmbE family N-acetylglucosaminyl deacetylase